MSSSNNQSCLVTGASGFVGKHVVASLVEEGNLVWSLSRNPAPSPEAITADLAAGPPHLPIRRLGRVFHVAGAAHRRPRSPEEAQVFEQVNVQGLRNLLTAVDRLSLPPEALVVVSSVAVYGREQGELLDEDTACRAQDPYGASKRIAEEIAVKWAAARGVRLALVRLPLVVGRDAPGNWQKLVDGLRRSRYLGIGDGEARRSMVLVDDVAPALSAAAKTGGVFHLTDGEHPSFREIESAVTEALSAPAPWRLPRFAATALAGVGDMALRLGLPSPFHRGVLRKLTSTLTFDDSRARRCLGWKPRPVLSEVRNFL